MSEAKPQVAMGGVAEDFQFSDSDLELISSDGQVFRIHKYKLQAASPVFRSVFETGNDDETGPHIGNFLKILYGRELNAPHYYEDLTYTCEGLWRLIEKYDAAPAKEHLHMCLWRWARSCDYSAHRFFWFASQMDFPDIGVAALQSEEILSWRNQQLKGVDTLDLASWSLYDFRQLDHEYILAWCRARRNALPDSAKQLDHKKMGTEFEKIMKAFRDQK
uniref:BTB domain-containing protein n=1 Tax=Kwoniella dejecticola CBS 10117 TaxID=1296121 RepID=A0A1A5ZVT4_9TREE|nr:uncharacterized protein I303_07822 [Kwoniella dejecticola CBS 10117]OBR81912.1 hypothetical protein I303_07822 [Kwoniella dejecticola CBS 10117]